MTLLAMRAETALVHIVTRMTIVAGRCRHELLVERTGMACQTVEAFMLAVQFEMRAGVVIELPGLPTVGVVARRAVLAEPVLVDIVLAMTGRALQRRIFVGRVGMTVLAGGRGMRAEQREARQVMLEFHLLAPAAFVVAGLAIAPFLAVMDIVGLVAGNTGGLDLLRTHRSGVAGLTGRLDVQAAQRVIGVAVVIEGGLRPFAAAVATFAVRAVAALMHVVARMTVIAGRRQFFCLWIALVAGRTSGSFVRADQAEMRIAVVIEPGLLPFLRAVATRALGAELAVVHVIAGMTRDTIGGGGLVTLIWMTAVAGHVAVLAAQRITGLAMVEARLAPADFAVAVGADLAELALVRVIFLMTVPTLLRRLAKRHARLVAGVAFHLQVRAVQRVVGLVVSEGFPVKFHDIHATPFMIGVAGLAFAPVDTRRASVVASLGAQIRRHILVTGKALLVLTGATEQLMTSLALCFEFCMRRSDRPGHHQRLHLARAGGRDHQQQQQAAHAPHHPHVEAHPHRWLQ